MQELEVTIIIPVYNASTYIEKCLHSILTQTYNNLQIIVVDDMSSDNTVEKCKKMQELDNRITLIRLNKNSGSAVARQKGIKKRKRTALCSAIVQCINTILY